MKRGPSMHDESLSEPPSTLSESAGASGLLPCPFCGGSATIEEIGPDAKDRDAYFRYSVGCDNADEPACMGYQSLTSFDRKTEAAKAWNTRAAPVQVAGIDPEILAITQRLIGKRTTGPTYNAAYATVQMIRERQAILTDLFAFDDYECTEAILALYPPIPVSGEAWQPIETAPKDGTPVDLWCVHSDTDILSRRLCDMVHVDYGAKRLWVRSIGHVLLTPLEDVLTPTHWMPLPATPVSAGLDDMGKQNGSEKL